MTSAGWEAQLLQPITADQPCGESLEDTDKLTSFDTFRLFGQARPLDAPVEQNEKGQPAETRIPKPPDSPEWREIRDKALETLGKSKDLRLLACLGTALLRTDGVPAFAETLNVAAYWLDTYWSQTYPLVDEDAILRRNALNCLADPMAVVDGLRKLPLVRSRQHGAFSLRDLDAGVNEEQVRAAFASMPIAELTQLHESVVGAVASLKKIDTKMRDAAGSEATPSFEPLPGSARKDESGAAWPACVASGGYGDHIGCGCDGRFRQRGFGERRRQVEAGRRPRPRRGCGFHQAHRAVESDPAVARACEASGIEGFSRGVGRYRARRRRAGTSGRWVEGR